MKETDFTRVLQSSSRDCGLLEFKVHGHAMQRPGWPDLEILLWGGRTLYLEVKVGSNWLSPIQQEVLKQMSIRGHAAGVLRVEGDIILYNYLGQGLLRWSYGSFSLETWTEIHQVLTSWHSET